MEYPDYQTLAVRREGPLLHLELNRPELMNAANACMELELAEFFTAVNRDAQTRW
jgi:enoyl-CoA hydratase/carnithine racemase